MDDDDRRVLRRLADKDAIAELVRSYSFFVDHRLYDELAALFTDDCVIDFGPAFGAPIQGRAAFRAILGNPDAPPGSRRDFLATSHHNANVFVTFDGDDHASVRTSVYAWHTTPDGSTPQLWGYYHDTVMRQAAEWLIATRQLRVLGVDGWDAEWHPALPYEQP